MMNFVNQFKGRRSLPVLAAPSAASDEVAASAAEVASSAAQLAGSAYGPRDIRSVRTLRISATDRCNLRCVYCMPEEGLRWLDKRSLLSFEEIVQVAQTAIGHGIRHFKITGGEPLLRANLVELVRLLKALDGCGELSLTTNALLLDRHAAELREAGLDRVTVSMDTLDAARFRQITRTGDLQRVWRGIEACESVGLGPVKINVVVIRAYNVDEIADFAALTLHSPRTVRFIEFMPLAESKALSGQDQFVPYAEMRGAIERAHGPLHSAARDAGHGPANVFRVAGARGKVGFIHAMSAPFCSSCNRLRLTPDGQLRSCLFDGGEVDLRPYLRPTRTQEKLRQAFIDCVVLKPDQHHRYGNRQMSQIGG